MLYYFKIMNCWSINHLNWRFKENHKNYPIVLWWFDLRILEWYFRFQILYTRKLKNTCILTILSQSFCSVERQLFCQKAWEFNNTPPKKTAERPGNYFSQPSELQIKNYHMAATGNISVFTFPMNNPSLISPAITRQTYKRKSTQCYSKMYSFTLSA